MKKIARLFLCFCLPLFWLSLSWAATPAEVNAEATENLFEKTTRLLAEGKTLEAIAEYQSFITLSDIRGVVPDEKVYLSLVDLLLDQGRKADAMNYMKVFIRQHDKSEVGQRLKKFNLESLEGDEYDAFRHQVSGLIHYHDHSSLDQALLLLQEGKVAESRQAFQQQIDTNPYNLDFYVTYYKALHEAGLEDEALATLQMIWDSDNDAEDICRAVERIVTECQ